MSFCPKGIAAAKDIIKKLTPTLESIIEAVLGFTHAVLSSESWPAIELLIQSLPCGAVVEAVIKTGIDALTKAEAILKEQNYLKKLDLFIADIKGLNILGQHALLIKLASILVAAIHASKIATGLNEEVHPESTYDTLVQLKAVDMKTEAPQPIVKTSPNIIVPPTKTVTKVPTKAPYKGNTGRRS